MKMGESPRAQDKQPVVKNNLKTKTIVSRTAYMVEDGVPASSILLFTFTKKAANEIKERVEKQLGDAAIGITVSTYHSFCAHQLRRYCAYAGYQDNFSIVDEDEQKELVKKLLKDRDSQTPVAAMISAISSFKSQHLTYRQAAQKKWDDPMTNEAVLVYEPYQKALKKNNAMDFDDLLFNMVTILENNEIVRQSLQNHYRYVVADEAQDSSVLDTKFIFLLMNPKTKNLCLVGDSDQAIYGFRGADVDKFFEKVNSVPHKNFVLGQNYRSTQNIVNAAQSIIQYNDRPDAKSIFSRNAVGEKVLHVTAPNQAREASTICSMIQNAVKKGEMKYGDAAILYRSSFLSRNIEDAMLRAGIPYQIVNGTSFYERKEIKDLVSFITFFNNPKNTLALKRIINIPKRGIGEKSLEKIQSSLLEKQQEYAIIGSKETLNILTEIAEENSRLSKKLMSFVQDCKEIWNYMAVMEENEHTPAQLIRKIRNVFHYDAYLKAFDKEGHEEREENVTELENIAATYESVDEFLESMLEADPEDDKDDSTDDKVKLMTMHGSKGLEFRIVFLIDVNAGILPSWRCNEAPDPQKAVQEERRLFYVAMTRAKENLVIFHSEKLMNRGILRNSSPSSFIRQIDPHFVEEV